MASSKGSDSSTKTSRSNNLPTGMRCEGLIEALFEAQLVDVAARAEQKRRLSKNNALNSVYSC